MDTNSSIVPYLFLVTFIIVLAIAVMQFRKARRARDEHHRSASAKVHGEPYASADAGRTHAGGATPGQPR